MAACQCCKLTHELRLSDSASSVDAGNVNVAHHTLPGSSAVTSVHQLCCRGARSEPRVALSRLQLREVRSPDVSPLTALQHPLHPLQCAGMCRRRRRRMCGWRCRPRCGAACTPPTPPGSRASWRTSGRATGPGSRYGAACSRSACRSPSCSLWLTLLPDAAHQQKAGAQQADVTLHTCDTS